MKLSTPQSTHHSSEDVALTSFTAAYSHLLQRAHRQYSDAELRAFPSTFSYNRHIREWQYKAQSLKRFQKYLKRYQGQDLKILDVGCGTGWFSASLARQVPIEVEGIDVHADSIEQARRVFSEARLSFTVGDFFEAPLPLSVYDMIIFNQSLEYFPHLGQVLTRCYALTKPGGEIHFIDTPFFTVPKLALAQQETQVHYEELKCKAMIPYHHHHLKESLKPYHTHNLYAPTPLLHGKKSLNHLPNSWIKITKD